VEEGGRWKAEEGRREGIRRRSGRRKAEGRRRAEGRNQKVEGEGGKPGRRKAERKTEGLRQKGRWEGGKPGRRKAEEVRRKAEGGRQKMVRTYNLRSQKIKISTTTRGREVMCGPCYSRS
jgi:hypothetical protein